MITQCVLIKTQEAKLAVLFLRDTADKAGKDWDQAVANLRASQKSGGATDRAALDAETARQRYIDLSTKLAEAGMIASLQERQQGDTLELIDPASLPSERKLPWAALAGATAAGGVLGWVIGYGLEGRRIRLALAQA